jgi:hypothetical protein
MHKTLNCLGRPCNEQSLRAYIMKAVKDARKSKVVEVSDDDDDDDDDNDDIDDDNNDDDNNDDDNNDDDNGQNVGVAGVATIAN